MPRKQFGRRPVIFCSNGYEHWLWDDASYPPRAFQGFPRRRALELTIQPRTSRKSSADAPLSEDGRTRLPDAGIRRAGEAFEQDRDRKALVASPFADVTPRGRNGLLTSSPLLLAVLDQVRAAALAT
jgi:type I site-specific restriction endonuclease